MLFDAHTHLNYEEYTEQEREDIAAEIEESDVGYIIDAGDSVRSSERSVCDAEKYDWCYAAVGIHPHHAKTANDEDIEAIRELAVRDKVVAIGEIGMDLYYGADIKAEQESLFRRQIRLANDLKMPIMIHSRDADQLTMDILIDEGAFSDERKSWFPERPGPDGEGGMPDARVQLHCYSGSAELAEQYVSLGATLSIGGPLTFKNSRRPVEVVQRMPLEYILSETDAPYLTPEPFRGRPNKSPYIEHVVRRMSILKGMEYDAVCDILLENGKRFFNIL